MGQRFKKLSGFFEFTDPTGKYHRGKTLWDWFQLILVPAVLFAGGYMLNRSLQARSEDIEADRAREMVLQNYFNVMKELMLDENLRVSPSDSEVRSLARSLTLTALRSLDDERKGLLIRFLSEAKLILWIEEEPPVILLWESDLSNANLMDVYLVGANLSRANLSKARMNHAELSLINLVNANLSEADLRGAFLSFADLRGANLKGADMSEANLIEADLEGADLSGANLTMADLHGANLLMANLKGANVTYQQLAEVETLIDAIMPDGKKFDPSIHKFQDAPVTP